MYIIFPIGRLKNVEFDLAGVKTMAVFKEIEIVDENDPHLDLLGI
jgi:hypothetical protein